VFLAIREEDKKLVGVINIRHTLNEYLYNYGGHIGYSVRKIERRKGYAKEMLKIALEECTKLEIEKVLITCDADNIASAKTIKSSGGILENEVPNDTEILFSKTESRERQDVEDFILYREKVFTENINSQELFNIQRALNIVKHQLNQSQENKIINLWAVLEYMLTFKETGGSIIAKVKDVIPKIVGLYIMKDKINIFWSRIYEQRGKNITIIEEFLECKKENEEYQYDINKLIEFINSKGPLLISELEFNETLSRDIAEIGLFLNDPTKLAKHIETKVQEIKHDLVRIYRARNVLIHSGKETKIDLNCKSLRLYTYNNNLIGLIIYYMCKNPHFKITEILNSIDYTYENYVKGLESGTIEKIEISKPKYLFIG